VFLNSDIVDAPGDLQFALPGFRHALLINREHDHRRVVCFRQPEDTVSFLTPAFQVG